MTARRRAGFTLLEAIAALAIVSIVCIGVLAAQGSALRAESIASRRVPLATLAAERVTSLDMYSGALTTLPDSMASGQFVAPFASARWTMRAEAVPGTNGLWNVTVTVHDDADSLAIRTRRYRPNTGTTR
jgi:prepilin-type N-terminal cleavage/methylation domain-containing protein